MQTGKLNFSDELLNNADGSCMIVLTTDAPLDHRNLLRLAKRTIIGMGKTGGIESNGSGDYVTVFSTADTLRVSYIVKQQITNKPVLQNDAMSPLFLATIEATEEAIINSLFAAETTTGLDRHKVDALPLDKVIPVLKKYNRIEK
jgi:D-aminopeptidase